MIVLVVMLLAGCFPENCNERQCDAPEGSYEVIPELTTYPELTDPVVRIEDGILILEYTLDDGTRVRAEYAQDASPPV